MYDIICNIQQKFVEFENTLNIKMTIYLLCIE